MRFLKKILQALITSAKLPSQVCFAKKHKMLYSNTHIDYSSHQNPVNYESYTLLTSHTIPSGDSASLILQIQIHFLSECIQCKERSAKSHFLV